MSLSLEEFAPATYEEWRAAAEESLKGAPFEKKLITPTPEGIALQPIYRKEDLEALKLPESWPGLAPFLRGSKPAGFKTNPWLMAQEISFGCPKRFNEALKSDLMRGQNAVYVLLDTATRRGVDPDAAAVGEVALCGLTLATKEDVETAFEGIDLLACPVLVDAGANGLPLAGLFASKAGKRGFRGAVLSDPLTAWAQAGSLPMPLDTAYRELAVLTRWGAENGVRTIGIQAKAWADAGANAVEELAFGLATGAAYFRTLGSRGLDAETIARQSVMVLSVGSQFFMEIAKFRAARLLWARMSEAFGAPAVPLYIHARSGLFNKSVLDPHTNMLRATSEAFSAAVGGVDSLHVAAFDEPIRQPDEFSRRIARNVHTILGEECNLSEVADAAGGSWFVESLTHELAQKAWSLFQEVEKLGGFAVALEAGFPQKTVARTSVGRTDAVAKRRAGLIGVNLFPNVAEKPLPPGDFDPALAQAERGKRIAGLRKGAPKIEESVESIAAAFDAGATLGQVTQALPRGGVTAECIVRIPIVRAAAGFEQLRETARKAPPLVWLAKFGPPKQSKARADFAAGFFAAGGYVCKQNAAGAKSVAEALESAVKAGARVVVVCSTDDTYPDIVPDFVPKLKAQVPDVKVILAGYPADQIESHRAAGVDDFIHIKTDCLAFLSQLHKTLGL